MLSIPLYFVCMQYDTGRPGNMHATPPCVHPLGSWTARQEMIIPLII